MAEKRNNGRLTPAEATIWRRFVNFIYELWRKTVSLLTGGRVSTMRPQNIESLLAALERHVLDGAPGGKIENSGVNDFEGAPHASVDSKDEQAHKAWEQLQDDMKEWARQLDEYKPDETTNRNLQVGHTPDVLKKLGAKAKVMLMMPRNLKKVRDTKGIPVELLKRLPEELSNPLMVFKSATMADSLVVLTELEHKGENLIAAVHLNVAHGNMLINDIASVHDRASKDKDGNVIVPGWEWFKKQIENGNLRYYDKNRSSQWFRERSGLQLPRVLNHESYRGIKILTEKNIVKPVQRPIDAENVGGNAPMASLLDGVKESWNGKAKNWSGISAADLRANPDLVSALGKVGSEKPGLKEKLAAFRSNWARTLEQGLFDAFAGIKDYSKEGYRLARMTTSLGTQLQAMIEYGAPIWKNGAMGIKDDSKGLSTVFEPVVGEMDRYLAWMIGNRAARLKAEGRENLFGEKEIAAMRGLRDGTIGDAVGGRARPLSDEAVSAEFTSADMRYGRESGQMQDGKSRAAVYDHVFKDFAEFKKAVLDFGQEAGLFTADSRQLWENADYIPFYRVQEAMEDARVSGPGKGKGLTGQKSGINTLKGGLENLGDPLENIMRNFAHMIDAAQKNRAAVQSLQDMERAGMAERVPFTRMKKELDLNGAEMREAIKGLWGNADALGAFSEKEKAAILALWRPPSGFHSVMVDGKQAWYTISDPLLHRAMTNMGRAAPDGGALFKSFRAMRRVLTTGVTAMPDFIVRNFSRDILSVWVQEHNSKYNPLDAVRALKDVYARNPAMRDLLASGGAFMGSGYKLGHNSEAAAGALKELLEKSGMDKKEFEGSILGSPKKLAAFLRKVFEHYGRAASASENAARLAVYENLLGQGYSHGEAAFAAKDLMDFTVRGEWATIRYLCETVPFLGARLAGLHRLGRGAMENPRAFAAKGFMLAAASVALYALNMAFNADDWDKLEDWDKDAYFHFWIGGQHFRLPKPFEVGFVFGTLPERIAEQIATDKPGKVLISRAALGIMEQLSFNPLPQAVRPLVEQAANKDFFRSRPIVSQGLERKVPVDQYTQNTSLTARGLAKFMDAVLTPLMGKSGGDMLRSPVRLEHMVNGFFGGLGMFTLGMSDMVMGGIVDAPEKPAMRLRDMPIVRSFYRGEKGEAGNARHVSAFYEAAREANQIYTMIRQAGQEGKAGETRSELSPEELALLAARKGLNKAADSISRLNQDAKRIRESITMSPEQKRKRLDFIQQRKNEIAKGVIKSLESKGWAA